MPKNKMSDLRDHLFETLEKLKDDDKPLEVERAQAICQVSNAIIETAKVEVKYAAAVGALPNDEFFGDIFGERQQRRLNGATDAADVPGKPNGKTV